VKSADIQRFLRKFAIVAVPAIATLLIGILLGAWWDPFGKKATSLIPPRTIDIGVGRYVSLGDSYAAGEGLKPWQPGTQNTGKNGDRCHRSLSASYSVDLRFDPQPTRVDFRACSGAIAANVYEEVQLHDGVPDQQGLQVKKGILGPDVRLVTLTMGGNDVRFANVLNTCFSVRNCVAAPYQGFSTLRAWIEAQISSLRPELLNLYQHLSQDAPNARIVVVGYPALFPEKAPSFVSPHNEACSLLLSHWDDGEREAIRAWGLELNALIQEDARAAGVDYVNIFPFFVGHEPCGPNGSWIRFVGLSLDSSIRDGSFHPTAEGQNQIARIVSCYLTVYPTYESVKSGGTESERFQLTGCVADAVPVSPVPNS
jgi:lysophospholipase L1-like esterase